MLHKYKIPPKASLTTPRRDETRGRGETNKLGRTARAQGQQVSGSRGDTWRHWASPGCSLCQGTRRNLCHPARVMLYTNSTVDADSPPPVPFSLFSFVPPTPLKLTFGNNCEQRCLRRCLRLPGSFNCGWGRLLLLRLLCPISIGYR